MSRHDRDQVEQRTNDTNANGEGPQPRRTAAEDDSPKVRGDGTTDKTRSQGSKARKGRARTRREAPRQENTYR